MQLAWRAVRAGRRRRARGSSLVPRSSSRPATSPTRCTTSPISSTARRSRATPTPRSTTPCSAPTTRTSSSGSSSTSGCCAKLARGLTTYRANATQAIAWYWHFVNVLTIVVIGDDPLGGAHDEPARRSACCSGSGSCSARPSWAAQHLVGSAITQADVRRGRRGLGHLERPSWQATLMVVAAALVVARRGGGASPSSRRTRGADFGDGPPERAPGRSAGARAPLLRDRLDRRERDLPDDHPPRRRRVRSSTSRAGSRDDGAVARPALARRRSSRRRPAAAVPASRSARARAGTSTAATASPATARTAAASTQDRGRSAPGRCASRPSSGAIAPVAAGRRRAGGRLLPAHGLHAARDGSASQPRRSRVLLRRAPDPRAHRLRRLARRGPADPARRIPSAATSPRGCTLFTDHCARLPPDRRRGRLRHRRGAAAARGRDATQIAEAVRIGPYVMPRFSKQAISDRELDSIIAYVELREAPGRPRRLGARAPRAGARGARHVVHRRRRACVALCMRDRRAAAAR